jgi:pyruvate dehydrogenase E2 component (dihydrolipoamide acetyltransferase)
MAHEVVMPQFGVTTTEAVISKWLKKIGDEVKIGEPIFEVETDKLTTNVESTVEGTLLKILYESGEKVQVTSTVAFIGDANEDVSKLVAGEANTFIAGVEDQLKGSSEPAKVVEEKEPEKKELKVKMSPVAKKIAKEKGLTNEELGNIKGTGPGGIISKNDILQYIEKKGAEVQPEAAPQAEAPQEKIEAPVAVNTASADTVKPLTNMRKVIGSRMQKSKNTAPHVTLTTEVNVDKTVELRNKINEKTTEVRISYTDILIKMVATALKRYPKINTSITEESLIFHDKVNIGVAVALEDGLVVPVVREADRKGLVTISKEAKELISKAKTNTLTPDDMSGATFTISNLGNYDIDGFTPVINLPESAILGVGRIVKKPVVNENNEIVPANMMVLSLSFDHRVVDGAQAAEFLKFLKGCLEDPNNIYM